MTPVARTPREAVRRPVLIDVTLAQGHMDAAIAVTPDLAGFAGHFPDFPILPGVMQLDWAVHFAQEYLQLEGPVLRVERLKFTCPITPDTRLRLTLSYDAGRSSVDFRFYRALNDAQAADAAGDLVFSQGRLIYAPETVDA